MLAEIEAALQRDWDRDTLAVYADLLIARDDPRGTLISLALTGTPDVPRIRACREAATDAWLGALAGRGRWLDGSTGFIRLTLGDRDAAAAFLDSHLAGYLRRLAIDARTPDEHAAILEALATHMHPWCAHVALDLPYAHETASLAPAAVARFFAAAPGVRELRLRSVALATLPASVRTLETDRAEGVFGATAVERVVARIGGPPETFAAFLGPARFPQLAEVDLADRHDAYAVLEHLDAPERLRWLRLPSLRDADEARQLAALRARCPELALELAVLHLPRAHLLDPALAIATPARVPCAPSGSYPREARFVVTIPDTPLAFELYEAELAANTEAFYDTFTPDERVALDLVFDVLARLGPAPVGVPGAAFARVAETMLASDCDAMTGLSPWGDILDALENQACSVQLRRSA